MPRRRMGLRFGRQQGALLLLPVVDARKRTPGNQNNISSSIAFKFPTARSKQKTRASSLLVHHSAGPPYMIAKLWPACATRIGAIIQLTKPTFERLPTVNIDLFNAKYIASTAFWWSSSSTGQPTDWGGGGRREKMLENETMSRRLLTSNEQINMMLKKRRALFVFWPSSDLF